MISDCALVRFLLLRHEGSVSGRAGDQGSSGCPPFTLRTLRVILDLLVHLSGESN